MKALLLIALLGSASPVLAQTSDPHAGHTMPGMDMPMPAPKPQGRPATADPHAGHDMAGMGQPDSDGELKGTDQPVGSAEPPPVVHDRPGDRYWDPAAMAASAAREMKPPRPTYSKLTLDLAEYRFRQGRDGFAWEGEAWLGDLDRLTIKTKGEGGFGDGLDHGEAQVLYSKALDPWWNLQGGVRRDFGAGPDRTYAALGIEGRAPYQFEVQAFAFVSDKGQLTGRLEGTYDQRITQRLILQPRVEVDLSAQDMPMERFGPGLNSAELGLRLRYEIKREFAPYVGINWTWAAGRTADYARADGHDPTERSLVAGIRFWF